MRFQRVTDPSTLSLLHADTNIKYLISAILCCKYAYTIDSFYTFNFRESKSIHYKHCMLLCN